GVLAGSDKTGLGGGIESFSLQVGSCSFLPPPFGVGVFWGDGMVSDQRRGLERSARFRRTALPPLLQGRRHFAALR
ncbi:hypothetical protein ACCS81_38480, partial [Rhizobium ruizarguesonis]